jgi:hypothetical protein
MYEGRWTILGWVGQWFIFGAVNRTYINWFAGCLGLAMYISMMMMMVGANFSSFWFPSSLFREL